jgi:DNA-binding PadR family transcriptional regulator
MMSNWLDRVGSVIPRGFSRHYVLTSIREVPMSGKEIIDKAIAQSGGIWKPSPGLIYPMLGRLIEEGLIDQMDDGRYKITTKGLAMINDLESVHNVFQKQFGVLLRVGSRGRFMTLDLLDRITNIGNALSSNLDKMTDQERKRYRHFLKTEIRKVDQQQTQESDNINKKDD